MTVELRSSPQLTLLRGGGSFTVPSLAAGGACDHEAVVTSAAPGRQVLRVHRLEFVGPDGRLRRGSGELVVDVAPAPVPAPRPPRRGSVFLSYRRSDSDPAVRWLASGLEEAFPGRVFHDHSSLRGGDLFEARITREILGSEVLVAVIGPTWLKAENEAGRRRLEIDGDLVRHEITTALSRGVDVVPLLVDGAEPPRPEQLPEPLRPLCDRHFVELAPTRHSLDRVVGLVSGFVGR
ncbi:toll/interleukin-1 receptor domain-containing protein [Actinomycetospora aeridis]|uniref:Toll/interleukin-1 receptor domain-containing protein n=1 Tax=Actinomycetospora aeridis TaxID=3129231 RepID=A0ABU8N971_9PSEU